MWRRASPVSLPMEECIADSLTVHKTISSHQYLSLCSKPHLMVSLWLCAVCNWSLACQQLFSEYVILKATNRILFKKKKIEHAYSFLCSDASCDQLLCVTVFTTCMQYPKINVCICFMSKYNCIQSHGNVEVSVLLTVTQNIVCN